MAGRAPLLLAAALFSLGAAGLLATLPGQDASRAFIPFLRTEPNSTPTPQLLSSAPGVLPALEFPGVSPTPSVTAPSRPAGSGAVLDATAPAAPTIAPKPTPTPPPPPLVIAAIASDPEETPTQGPLRIGMVGSDSEPSPSPTAAASATPAVPASPGALETTTPAGD